MHLHSVIVHFLFAFYFIHDKYAGITLFDLKSKFL